MKLFSNNNNFFGLDIGTNSIRVVQLNGIDRSKPKDLLRYAYSPIDSKLVFSESKVDRAQLSQNLKDLVLKAGITTKNVAVGLSSGRVFTAVVDIDKLKESEMAKSISYQADVFIPTSIEDSIIDWAILGESPKDKTKADLLLSSTTKDFTISQLDLIESAGLNVIAFEPDVMAISRSLVPLSNMDTVVIVDIGARSTDLVVLFNNLPHLARSISIGGDTIVRAVAQNLNSEISQAEQFLYKFGISKDKIEGQIYQAAISTIESLMIEIEKSIKFFNERYVNQKITKIIVAGVGAIIPELPVFVANRFSISVEIGNAWTNVNFNPEIRAQLMAVSNQFSVAVGLAERY